MPFGPRAEHRVALRVFEEVGDFAELAGRLIDAGDVIPGDSRLGRRLDNLRLDIIPTTRQRR